jgi:arginine exporter protein ArgO
LSSIPVMTTDGTPMPLAGVGSVVTPHLSLPNVYLIPKLKLNLASVGQIYDSADYLVMFFWFFLLCTGSAVSEADWDRP